MPFKLPCETCPVLAICVTKQLIECPILLEYVNRDEVRHSKRNSILGIIRRVLKSDEWYAIYFRGKFQYIIKVVVNEV